MGTEHSKTSQNDPSGPRVAIAVYRPNPGHEAELVKMIREHLPTLRKLGLATDRPAMLLQAADGTYLEVFEWASEDATRQAHEHPAVARIWEGMGKVASFPALESLAEAKRPFSHYRPVTL